MKLFNFWFLFQIIYFLFYIYISSKEEFVYFNSGCTIHYSSYCDLWRESWQVILKKILSIEVSRKPNTCIRESNSLNYFSIIYRSIKSMNIPQVREYNLLLKCYKINECYYFNYHKFEKICPQRMNLVGGFLLWDSSLLLYSIVMINIFLVWININWK